LNYVFPTQAKRILGLQLVPRGFPHPVPSIMYAMANILGISDMRALAKYAIGAADFA